MGKAKLTLIQLSLWILQNVARNARLILSLRNLLLQSIQQERHILVSPLSPLHRIIARLGKQPHQRNIILPVIASRSEVTNRALDITDLLQQLVINLAVDSVAIVQSERSVESKPLEICNWINVLLAVAAVVQELFDGDVGLEIDDGHVGLHCRPVESCGSGFSSLFARLVPW